MGVRGADHCRRAANPVLAALSTGDLSVRDRISNVENLLSVTLIIVILGKVKNERKVATYISCV